VFRGLLALLVALAGTFGAFASEAKPLPAASTSTAEAASGARKAIPAWLDARLPFAKRLAAAAEERSHHRVTYDGTGYAIAYPMGDVPANKGTCTDEVVRAYRLVGIDLQQLVHEDMLRKFNVYPTKFHMRAPDPNIDHRRTWNLQTFFNRNAEVLPISDAGKDYAPGDIVLWDLDNFQLHIGMVTSRWSKKHKRPLIMHNISRGPQIEDKLFEYRIVGHYRYAGGLKPDLVPPPDLWAAVP
jgi:uncharacterized protein YijF (DUF1287 family)